MKVHWIRKHRVSGPSFCDEDGRIENTYMYDFYSACGRVAVINGTVFRNKVTCKTCLKAMKKHEKL